MGKALCCGEQPVLIAFTQIVLLAPELCGEFSHHLRAGALLERSQPAS
jgi:hypothetical protein